jgi:hypothetical protein
MILLGYRDEYSDVPLGKQGESEGPPLKTAYRVPSGAKLAIVINQSIPTAEGKLLCGKWP